MGIIIILIEKGGNFQVFHFGSLTMACQITWLFKICDRRTRNISFLDLFTHLHILFSLWKVAGSNLNCYQRVPGNQNTKNNNQENTFVLALNPSKGHDSRSQIYCTGYPPLDENIVDVNLSPFKYSTLSTFHSLQKMALKWQLINHMAS